MKRADWVQQHQHRHYWRVYVSTSQLFVLWLPTLSYYQDHENQHFPRNSWLLTFVWRIILDKTSVNVANLSWRQYEAVNVSEAVVDRHSRGATQHPLTLAEPAIRQYITTARDYHNCLIERNDCVRSDAMTHVLYKLLTTFIVHVPEVVKHKESVYSWFIIYDRQQTEIISARAESVGWCQWTMCHAEAVQCVHSTMTVTQSTLLVMWGGNSTLWGIAATSQWEHRAEDTHPPPHLLRSPITN